MVIIYLFVEFRMKTIPAGQFKAHCLSLLDEISKKQGRLVVTKHGKPVAQVVPFHSKEKPSENPLKNSVVFEGNIVDPIDEGWEAAS